MIDSVSIADRKFNIEKRKSLDIRFKTCKYELNKKLVKKGNIKKNTIYGLYLMMHINRPLGDASGVLVIVVENKHGDTSSNPGRD